MSTGFEDIEDLLSEIVGGPATKLTKPSSILGKTAKGAPKPLPKQTYEAIRDTAIESMDPELLEIAATEGRSLSSEGGLKKAERLLEKMPEIVGDDAVAVIEATRPEPLAAFAAPVPKKGKKGTAKKKATAPAAKGPPKRGVTQGVTKVATDTEDRKREEQLDTLRIPMPKFNTADFAEAIDIRALATLVMLKTARWHAKAKDRKASNDAAAANGAVNEAFETRKRLLVGADEKLKAIHKIIDAARQKHYDMTLPWSAVEEGKRTGARLLPNTLFMEYTTEMASFKREMVKSLKEFVPEYPAMIQTAKSKLGKRFDVSEYPAVESIAGHFDLSFDFQPVPKGDDFRGLEKAQLDRLASTVNQRTEQMMENAMQETWTRLYKAVSHMYDRLSSPDKAFHYTMTDNIREVTRMLKHLNVMDVKDIEQIRIYLDKFICPHDADALRESPELRRTTAAHVKNVLDKMDKLGKKK
jgi:hypothetical protein